MTTSGRPSEQRADIDGSGNVIVQILGNDNQVDFGRAYLKLTRYLTRRRVDSDADLLSPYARSIPLVGRQQEMAELRAWLESGRPISVRVLTGRAGAGKTRLSLELCEQMLPDAFTPDLALSLSVLADRLEETDRLPEAIEHDAQALLALTLYLLMFPQGLGGRARALGADYVRRCAKLGREPDVELLGPIAEVLQRLEESER